MADLITVNNDSPSLSRADSFDKSMNASPGPPGDDESENGSEIAGPTSTPPASGKKKMGSGPGKKKGKTPKSKLAQEIVIRDDNESTTPVEAITE